MIETFDTIIFFRQDISNSRYIHTGAHDRAPNTRINTCLPRALCPDGTSPPPLATWTGCRTSPVASRRKLDKETKRTDRLYVRRTNQNGPGSRKRLQHLITPIWRRRATKPRPRGSPPPTISNAQTYDHEYQQREEEGGGRKEGGREGCRCRLRSSNTPITKKRS